MFSNDIRLYGKHAEYLKTYSKDKQGESQFYYVLRDNENKPHNTYVFETMIQCYMVAAMIGIIEQKQAPVDNSNKEIYSNIMTEQVTRNLSDLKRIAHFMILTENEGSVDARIKRAFTIKKNEDDDIDKRIAAYARGGLEILDSYFHKCKTYEDLANVILYLMDKYSLEFDSEEEY